MRHFFYHITLLALLTISMASCQSEYTVYSGPNHIMFSDTMFVMPVEQGDSIYRVTISATCAAPHDRCVGVEIVASESNAVEGYHYDLVSSTVTIPAGKLTADVELIGHYDNVTIADSIGVVLRLACDKKDEWSLYGTDTKVMMQKVCPFDINAFVGPCMVISSYMQDYMPTKDRLLRYSELDPEEENTIIIRDYFYEGYDVKIHFTTDDKLNPLLTMEEQVFGSTAEAFGTIYGNGKIMMYQSTYGPSYYSTCENFIFQYVTLYVAGVGTVGTYMNAVRWLSEDEAEQMRQENYE